MAGAVTGDRLWAGKAGRAAAAVLSPNLTGAAGQRRHSTARLLDGANGVIAGVGDIEHAATPGEPERRSKSGLVFSAVARTFRARSHQRPRFLRRRRDHANGVVAAVG